MMGKSKRQTRSFEQQSLAKRPENREGRRFRYVWAVLVAVIAVLVMIIWSITVYSSGRSRIPEPRFSPSKTSKVYRTVGEIDFKTLSLPQASFAKECAQKGLPVVLRNSIVTKWQARNWSPTYLQSKLKSLSGIYENDNHWFGPYFDKSKPLLNYAVRKNSYKTDIELSSQEFFQRLDKLSKNRYHYFTGDIEQLGEWAYSEIHPISELLILNPKRSSINAWMGQPHVIAHCHYDGYHNFYAQLYGTKKFTLFSPINWPGLYPYPFLHPSHAQAQVNATDREDVERFKLIKNVEALEVVLEPGDLLYLPPLWFHEVESMSVSISVNVWTDSHQTELVEKLFSLPLPLDSNYESSHGHKHIEWNDEHERFIGGAVLIFRLLESVCKFQTCCSASSDRFLDLSSWPKLVNLHAINAYNYFVHQLWSTRYAHLMEEELPSKFHNGSHILCKEGSNQDLQVTLTVDENIQNDVHYGAYLEQVSQLVRGLPKETWQLWIGNYVEYMVANIVSDVKYVGLFLQHFSSCTKHLKI